MKKIVLGDIEKCYSCMGAVLDGMPHLFFAGEGNGRLLVFYGESFQKTASIWEGGGGTMSIASVPINPNAFLASRGFYSLCDAKDSTVELITYEDGRFSHRPIMHLPWLHRFDTICGGDGTCYLVAASIADSKTTKEDWSQPGHIYWAVLEPSAPLQLHRLEGDYFQNHGFFRGKDRIYIGSREGAFSILPPDKRGQAWEIRQVLTGPVSDLAVCDIDQDGEDEIACITPFHGNCYQVFRNGQPIYTHLIENDFYHTVTCGEIDGRPAFIGGARQKTASLFQLFWEHSGIRAEELDRGCGPSNAAILNTPSADLLLAANRQIGQAAVYLFPKS